MKQIVIVLHADGRVEADVQGFVGSGCDKDAVLKAIRAMLAPESRQERKKPEYYQRQEAQARQGG